MDLNSFNTTTTHSDLDNINIHHEANQPKLQWLLILIPIIGVFAMYTFYHVRYKRRKRKQLLDEEEASIIPATMTNVIPLVPPSILSSQANNCSEISLVRLPNSEGLYVSVNNTMDQRGRRESRREESTRLSAPPPVYSISSPPVYEEVVDLRTNINTTHPNSS